MKKTYEKPRVYIERLELAEHIASNCNLLFNYQDKSCIYLNDGGETFTINYTCQENVDEDFCVYNASGTMNIFTS